MKKRLLFESGMGDVSDPEVYASGIVCTWENTDAGRWAKKHVKNKRIWYTNDLALGWEENLIIYKVQVFGEMTDKNYTYYSLKWSDPR